MASVFQKLLEKNLLKEAPSFLKSNIHYETLMGSHAYGVADTAVRAESPADYDVYGIAIPPKDYLFPHLRGEILGFGTPGPTFEKPFQKHHILEKDALGGQGKLWDIQIFNIVRFFELCRHNNPNMIEMLYTPEECVLYCSAIGRLIREKRTLFLSKKCWPRFRGYAHQQLKKMNDKQAQGKRKDLIERHGYDVKFAYHIIRLMDEADQILSTGTLDIQRARKEMKAVRRGDWSAQEVREWAMEKEKSLEFIYAKCTLPEEPEEEKLMQLLKEALSLHYENLETEVPTPQWAESALKEMDHILQKYRNQLYH